MRNFKEWFSANELTEFEGLPNSPQGINKKARTQQWKKRNKDGVQGGAVEYHYSSLPESVQLALGFELNRNLSETAPPTPAITAAQSADSLELVPFYDVQASAGFTAISEGAYAPDDYIGLSKRWLNLRGFYLNKLAFITASGDSMYPTISDGDMLLINLASKQPKDGKIYVLRSGEQIWVKRVQGIINGIRLISDNKAIYSPVDVIFDDSLDFEVIGQVVYIGHDLI
ncbi:helix-turn-helix domain-containing protein [Avibacterium sp. 20-129]|uniref:helix-turn-helix domain-containing protein n=1 Tax=Avibacterium sp. 20-129 TaxID=2911525 RepID=UPI0022481C18|nr:S24 family peptidase [Avibacterium sp. 20-129]MCW9698166.1 helix-turn-helix transcriptional regulator [Avibacterium sp. 20-129]